MIKEEYKNGCRLKEQVKYNIDYDDCQILNLTCANYIYDLVQESSKYETKLEDVKKMLYMIEKLLGHEVQYDIPEYHGDNKKCYFGSVSDNFVIDENNIKQLDYVLQDSKEFVESFSTDYQKILYCYPNEFGDINSIKDQNQFEIKESFQRNAVTIDGILYYDETSDIVENGFINTQLINFFKENSLFSPNVFTYETYNVTTIIDATTFPVTYSSREIYNLNTHIKFKLRGNGKVIFRYKNDIGNIVETPPYSSQDIDLCYNYNYTLKILPSSYYVNRIVIKDINPITLSGNSFIIAQSEDVYIKNTRDYLVFIQNNSICKVHYSIGNNNNYRTYTINPGTSIIMETEIENITMFPAGNNRPNMPVVGYQYFDTTINKPIFWDGTKWIDATGATV